MKTLEKNTSLLYHKIQSIYKRDPENNHKTFLDGDYSLPEFKYLAYNDWEGTEKIDGTNIRVIISEGEILFRGKTDNSQLYMPLVERLGDIFNMDMVNRIFDIKKDRKCEIVLFGEGYGAKIQKGGGYRKDPDFILFDVNINGSWLERGNVEDIASKFGILHTPVIIGGTLLDAVEYVKQGFTSSISEDKELIAEGLVLRPTRELCCRNGDRIITKIKHKDFKRN